MTKITNTLATAGILATTGDVAPAPHGFRVLRSTPSCVQDRGTVRLGGMSPFAARAKAAAPIARRTTPRG